MNLRKIIAFVFLLIALVLGIIFYLQLQFPQGLESYFDKEYYNQFGPLAICVELLIAGYQLFFKHAKTNFTLALFAFTAILDPVFNAVGLFVTNLPLYGTVLFIICAIIALWIAFTNKFGLGRISFYWAFGGFVLGVIVELFFNYW
ncbi:MAG: hypothetical protein ACR2MM_01615 [Flavobacteriaceae bacterium]